MSECALTSSPPTRPVRAAASMSSAPCFGGLGPLSSCASNRASSFASLVIALNSRGVSAEPPPRGKGAASSVSHVAGSATGDFFCCFCRSSSFNASPMEGGATALSFQG